jgi:hypothetical protein
MKARDIIELSQMETAIGEYNKNTALTFIISGVRDTVREYYLAGEYKRERFIVGDDKSYTPEREVANIVSVHSAGGRALSPNTEYELLNDNSIVFGNTRGEFEVIYYGFPDTTQFTEDSDIPLPPQFQEALHWYLSAKYYGRVMSPTDERCSYFKQSYNADCRKANSFYSTGRTRRRLPARRMG